MHMKIMQIAKGSGGGGGGLGVLPYKGLVGIATVPLDGVAFS